MNDPAWCRAQLDQREDGLRRLSYSNNLFTTELDETRLAWNDAAARDTFGRYLDPFRTEMVQALNCLTSQTSALRDVVARMEEAEQPATEIQTFSEESTRQRQEADGEIYTVHHRVDRALDEAASAMDYADQARQVLASI